MLKRKAPVRADEDSGTDSDDAIIKALASRDDTKHHVEKFEATRARLWEKARKRSAMTEDAPIVTGGVRGGLCHPCRSFHIDDLRGGSYPLHFSFKSLRQSAETCKLCRLVLLSLRRLHADLDGSLASSASSSIGLGIEYSYDGISNNRIREDFLKHLDQTFSLSMNACSDSSGVVYVDVQVVQRQGLKTPRSSNLVAHSSPNSYLHLRGTLMMYTTTDIISNKLLIPIDPRPRDDDKFALMEKWLVEDVDRQLRFASPDYNSSEVRNPSRLIRLPSSENLRKHRLCLVDTSSDAPASPYVNRSGYVTLSHRWGQHCSFTTTRSNLAERQCGFHFDELPQTYRDAAIVASRLGYQYLWIDSVCIVQDDADDWAVESKAMGDIYRSASFTIASHCSEDDGQGFLAQALGKRGSVKLNQENHPSTFIRPAADLELDVSTSPLSKRGWILQERFLSCRLMHFTAGMIYWETTSHTLSEDGALPNIKKLQSERMSPPADVLASADKTNRPPDSRRTAKEFVAQASLNLRAFSQALRRSETRGSPASPSLSPLEWFSLVEMYSTCSLTKEKDKLMAISGIAKVLQRQLRISYLAGIWADRVAIGLWWLNVGGPLKNPKVARAASWSWAAWDGPVQFPLATPEGTLQYRTDCYLLDSSYPTAQDAGWLNGHGAITLRTKVLDVTCALRKGLIRAPGHRVSIFQDDLPLWRQNEHALWSTVTDPPLRLFNVSSAYLLDIGFEEQENDNSDEDDVDGNDDDDDESDEGDSDESVSDEDYNAIMCL